MPEFVRVALKEHMRQFPPAEDGTLFTTRYGSPYSHDYYGAQIFKRAVRATPAIPNTTTTHELAPPLRVSAVAGRRVGDRGRLSGSATRTQPWCSRPTGT